MRSTSKRAGKKKASPRASKKKVAKLEIGWREWVALPQLCDRDILAKIDTGAKTSALHAHRIREVSVDGRPHVEFYIHPVQKRRRPEVYCVAPIHDRRSIKSSNGAEQERIVILARLRLGTRLRQIELSLANRDDMGFRLLIGRDALGKNVIIHPARSYLLGR
ncbi:MAG: ATP-dependent zinc protease [Parvularculaceae bacterium]|nr:ATP-dependent zinc protease [Parvularculaceae bacterium]